MVEIVIAPSPELPSNVLSDADIAVGTAGLGHWINQVIAPSYSQGPYRVSAAGRGQPVPLGTDHRWIVALHANSDVPGAAGYHTADNGCPAAKIFVADLLAAGMSWTAVASHEIAELMVNRFVNEAVLGPAGFYWKESCDPVEAFGGTFAGIRVSDFVLPHYWLQGSAGPYSHFSHAPAPLTPGIQGRQEVYQISGATQISGAHISSITPPPLS